MELYRQELLDHYRFPRNRGKLIHAHFESEQYNPSCGDRVMFQGKCANGQLLEVAFDGAGCVISLATASMLSEQAKNKPITYINTLTAQDVFQLIGMDLGPTRAKCALLSLYALQQGLQVYLKQQDDVK